MNRGVLVILTMFGVAAGLGVVAIVFLYSQGSRAMDFWGRDAAVLIRKAPQVELLWLESSAEGDQPRVFVEQLSIEDRPVRAVKVQDITDSRGLVHARHALITDASFDWDNPRGDCQPKWSYALRFTDGAEQAIVAVDLPCQRVRLVSHGQEASIAPSAEAFDEFAQRYKEAEKTEKSSP